MDAESIRNLRRALGLTEQEIKDITGIEINRCEEEGISVSDWRLLVSLGELVASNVEVKEIKIDEEGNITAFDKKGARYGGQAVPLGDNNS